MKSILLFLLAVSIGFSQGKEDSSVATTRAALLALDDEWNVASLKRDMSYFSRTLPQPFLFVDEKGRVFSRLNFISSVSETFYTAAESKDREIDLYDDFAVLVGARTERFRQPLPDSQERFRRVRYVKVFKRDGRDWQVVSYQETPIGPF
jgi:hypothetical protein